MSSPNNTDYLMPASPAVTNEEAIRGARLLVSLEDWFRRHVVVPVGVPLVLSLWAVNTYMFELFDHCPYVALVSPVKRCGKSTALKLLANICRRPAFTVNISDAALFRLIDTRRPTLLMDEVEDLQRSSLRAILNAGFEQAATVPRCVGHQVQDFRVFCPKALACIGQLPDTIADRSIIIPMQRAKRGENVAEFRRRTLGNITALAEEIGAWATANKQYVAEAYHQNTIDFLSGREVDVWENLFAIIRVAAPERIDELKTAAIRLVAEKAQYDTDSEESVIRLLSDLRAVFAAEATELMPTSRLLWELRNLSDGPTRLSGIELARKLRPFKIGPKQLWVDGKNLRGYLRRDFVDVFERYLPAAEDNGSEDSRQEAKKASGLAGLAAKEGRNSERAPIAPEDQTLSSTPSGSSAGSTAGEREAGGVRPPSSCTNTSENRP